MAHIINMFLSASVLIGMDGKRNSRQTDYLIFLNRHPSDSLIL